jgi:7-cyano-7-deazaguanine reductase
MPTQPSKRLETFDNPHPERDFTIEIRMPEFTCLCPKTGQPDFATLYLDYVPNRKCVELKSLKLYIWSFRNEGAFHEAVTNTILNDLVSATSPRYMRLRAEFYVRGGIYTNVVVEHRKAGWEPPPAITRLPETEEVSPPAGDKPAASAPPAAKKPVPNEPVSTPRRPAPASAPASPAPTSGAGSVGRFRMLPRVRRPATEDETPASEAEAEPEPVAEPVQPAKDSIYLGIDMGTGGCRVVAINQAGDVLAQVGAPIPMPLKNDNQITQDADLWWKALSSALTNLLKEVPAAKVAAIAVDGTSGTLLLCDKKGNPTQPALMYNDNRATAQAETILSCASPSSGAQGATSSLAKLLWLQENGMDKKAAHALHQADWIVGKLTGEWHHSDYNNCLKLGYDAQKRVWPGFIKQLGINEALLPTVHAPGEAIATVSADTARTFGLPPSTQVVAGTTDGVAAFLAAGGNQVGDGVTSLGSTLVLKLLSNKPLFSAEHGVYSHRLGDRWLTGGASNSGGATLLQYFKVEQMREMTPLLEPDNPTGLHYYPLPDVGERFPVHDPNMQPKLEPLPGNSVTFFQGMLEGIAKIEADGYRLLHKLGGPAVREIRTTGGGSRNPAWQRIREHTLGVRLKSPVSEMAAYGAALLAAGRVEKPT